MNKVQEKRLLKIIAHLRHGELAHENFDFNIINYPIGLKFYKKVQSKKVKNCGTNGCAIGEFPLLFKSFSYSKEGRLLYKKNELNSFYNKKCIEDFLGVSRGYVNAMFYSNCRVVFEKNDSRVVVYSPEPGATRYEVADNIEKLLCMYKEGYKSIA